MTWTAHGKTAGEYYFVSDSSAGAISDTDSILYSNPICYILDANTVLVLHYRPAQYATSANGVDMLMLNWFIK